MAKQTDSFQYGIDNLALVPENNVNRQYDYYNNLIDKYQSERYDIIKQKQDFDEMALGKERYSSVPVFTSQAGPFDDKALIIAVRSNGYLAFIDEIPDFNPISDRAVVSVDSVTDYMNNYYDVNDQGFFLFKGKLTCIIDKSNLLRIKFPTLVNPLLFCENYTYDDTAKTITFASPYYEETVVNAYTRSEFIALVDSGPYFFITNSTYDTIPKGKYPGYPVYKRIIVDGVTNNFDTVIVNGVSIAVSTNKGKVIKIPYEEAIDGNLYAYLQASGSESYLHVIFTPKYSEDIKPFYELPVVFVKGTVRYDKTAEIPTSTNTFFPLTELIKVENDDVYLEVPTVYTLTIKPTTYLNQTRLKALKQIELSYLDVVRNIPISFSKLNTDGSVVFVTDSIILPDMDDVPKELKFRLITTATDSITTNVPLYLHGYTKSNIYKIPEEFISVKATMATKANYTENATTNYPITFKGNGNLTLVDIELKRVYSDLELFGKSDFTFTKTSESNGLFTYQLGLSKKVFKQPDGRKVDNLRFIFNYKTTKANGNVVWQESESVPVEMTIAFINDRWEIRNVTIVNPLIGDTDISFKVFDKLLNQYTDLFSDDVRLHLDGILTFSSNVVNPNTGYAWDSRTQLWFATVRILTYGDVTMMYSNSVAKSNTVTIKHVQPTIPLNVTIRLTTLYENVLGRVYVDLTYTENVTKLYVNGIRADRDSPFPHASSLDGVGYMTAIWSADKKKIIALGIDLMPVEGISSITIDLNVTQVNERDYTGWSLPIKTTVPVKPQTEGPNFTFRTVNFEYGKPSVGVITLKLAELEDAKVVASIINPATNRVIDTPNFDPQGDSTHKTDTLLIPANLSDQKQFIISFVTTEYDNAAKDNLLPNHLYYITKLTFGV